jgi:hypothetical protein
LGHFAGLLMVMPRKRRFRYTAFSTRNVIDIAEQKECRLGFEQDDLRSAPTEKMALDARSRTALQLPSPHDQTLAEARQAATSDQDA